MADATKKEWYADGLRFSCNQCGNCCSGPPGFVWYDEHEAKAMADELNMSVSEFQKTYTHKVHGHRTLDERWNPAINGYDCVFLRRDEQGKALCSIYAVRPQQCRTWPFWPDNLRSETGYMRAGQRCEGMIKGLQGEGRLYSIEEIRIIRDNTP